MARRRRLGEGMMPLIAAGLLRFERAKELERIRIDPRLVIFLGFTVPAILLILYFLF